MATHPIVSAGTWGTQTGGATADALGGTPADYAVWCPGMPIKVTHFGFVVTTVVASDTTDGVVALDHRVTAGSDTGRVEKDTITVPDTTAVGKVLVATPTPFIVGLGEELVFEHKTQAADASSVTGAGHYFVAYETLPGVDTTDTNYVAA